MYVFLRGTVAHKALDHIALEVRGLGFQVFVPEGVYRKLVPNQEILLYTHCVIREDAFQIYGFLKEEERALFLLLLGINKVGAKVALSVMSHFSLAEFGRAVTESDVKAFTRVPGVGKTMAPRLVLELKNKMGQSTELSALIGDDTKSDTGLVADDAYEAMLSLGCTPVEAKRAVLHARKELGEGAKDEEVVRIALRSMAKVK